MRSDTRSTSSISLISNGRVTTSTSFPVTLHQRVPETPKIVRDIDDSHVAQVHSSDWWDIQLWLKNNKLKFPRILLMTLFIGTASYQVAMQIKDFFGFPTGVNVLVDEPASLRDALPGVTLCHNNRYMKSKVDPLYQEWLKTRMSDNDKYEFEEKAKPLNSTRYEQLFNFSKFIEDEFGELASIDLTSSFTTTAEEFIKYLKCDPSWSTDAEGHYFDCENIPVIEFMHFTGRCFTLFHNLSTIADVGPKIGLKRKNTLMKNPKNHIIEGGDFIPVDPNDRFSKIAPTQSPPKSVTTKDTKDPKEEAAKPYDFAPNEIIQVMLNFTPSELMDPYAKASGRIYIHDIAHIPGMTENNFDLEPGYYYEFYIRAIKTNQLPAPYSTNCFNYFDMALPKIRETGDLGYPMTSSECIQACQTRYLVDKAGMSYPPEAPWFKESIYENRSEINTYFKKKVRPRWGTWRSKYPSGSSKSRYYEWGLMFLPACMAECGIDCSRTTYEVITAKDRWPFKDIIETATDEEKKRIEIMQKTAAFVSIRYSTYVQTVRDFEPRFASVEGFIAGIGGLVSLWIGISALSLYDFIAEMILKFYQSH